VRILTPFGAEALAGYTIALRIIIVALLPSWGMSNAVATLVGQNLGARKPERAERSVITVGLYNMAFLLGVMLVFLWGAEPPVAIFTADHAVQALGAQCLRVVSYGYAFYAWGMVLVQAFNGAGDTRRVAARGGGPRGLPPWRLAAAAGVKRYFWLLGLRADREEQASQ
jgi:Na+-driven multidrug efflux pump